MLILASQSKSRAQILANAGLSFQIYPSGVNEETIKVSCQEQGMSASQTTYLLALAKAESVARVFPERYVLGADQMLECEGRWFDKARTIAEAREQLQFLRSKTHVLPTSVVIVHRGQIVWQETVISSLTMRSYSDAFIDHYLEALQTDVLRSVGCYQIEGRGAQMFTKVSGDIFSIMGLPLLPLLAFLRQVGLAVE
jgi:septum formation protein